MNKYILLTLVLFGCSESPENANPVPFLSPNDSEPLDCRADNIQLRKDHMKQCKGKHCFEESVYLYCGQMDLEK